MEQIVKVSGKGSIKIPVDILRDYGIADGDLLRFEASGKTITLVKTKP